MAAKGGTTEYAVLGMLALGPGSGYDLKKRIDEAARYVPLDQCALSHQCGFSSTAHGNDLTEADEWKKLARTVEVAREVWGEAQSSESPKVKGKSV